jgi:hypothetical protein
LACTTYSTLHVHTNKWSSTHHIALPASPAAPALSKDLQSAGLENLQEELQIPNHRVPLSANGVQQSFAAGELVHELLHDAHDHHQQQQHQQNGHSASSCSSSSGSRASSKVFMYTSPFLRCIQTAQHVVQALKDEQVGLLAVKLLNTCQPYLRRCVTALLEPYLKTCGTCCIQLQLIHTLV